MRLEKGNSMDWFKKHIDPVFILSAVLVIINNSVSAATVPTENMIVTSDTILVGSTYYFNDTDDNGTIQIGSDN